MATIYERVRKVTIEQLGVSEDEVSAVSNFASELGADSLDQVELIMALEEEFSTPEHKISIPDEDAEKIITVQDAVDYLKKLGVSDFQQIQKPAVKQPAKIAISKPLFNKTAAPKIDTAKSDASKINQSGSSQIPNGKHPSRRSRSGRDNRRYESQRPVQQPNQKNNRNDDNQGKAGEQ